MGASDTEQKGYPKSLQKRDWTIYLYCGGSGGGGCPYVQNKTQVRFGIDLNPFIVSNDSITLRNPEFGGFVVYPNLGSDGFCPDSFVLGAEAGWYLGFSNDGVMTDAEVIAQGLFQAAHITPPYDIQVSKNKLPQPTDSDWSGTLYIHIVWTNPSYIADELYLDDIQYLRVVQHNYQVRH